MADLKVTIREELTLNDYDHGARNSLVIADIDEVETSVPLDPDNMHYAEILKQVDAGELTIADAD